MKAGVFYKEGDIRFDDFADPVCGDDDVIIKVINKGKEIPQEKLNRIFENFYRLDSARTSRTGGSGLGLAIAKEIVELHHGSIFASSDKEETVFTITLPKN